MCRHEQYQTRVIHEGARIYKHKSAARWVKIQNSKRKDKVDNKEAHNLQKEIIQRPRQLSCKLKIKVFRYLK